VSPFLEHMAAQVILDKRKDQERARGGGRQIFLATPDLDPRPYVLATPPFDESRPGQLWDEEKYRAVPCPQRDQLAGELADILAGYAKLYIHGIHRRLRDERHQIERALGTLQTFLERQGAPRRHKRLLGRLDDVAAGITALADRVYERGVARPWEVKLDREWRDWWTEQQGHLVVQLYDAFQRHGPAPQDFPRASIYRGMAEILKALGLEPTLGPKAHKDLPLALRKRHYKALSLE
jgi:hypothetical protein